MKLSSAIPLVALLFATASLSVAASDTELVIKGAITPSACEPMISGEGLIDFGKMSVKQLNTDAYTSLPRETLDFQVLCEGPTFFTFNTIDNRSGTSAHNEGYHGLGMTPNGEKLGGAGFGIYQLVADNVSRRPIISTDGGMTWQRASLVSPQVLTAVATDGELAPIAVQVLKAQLSLFTHIAPSRSLTLIDEVPLDGNATVQVNYL